MIQLAFSTNAFKKASLEEAIDTIGRIGYRGVEIMADVPHAYPPSMDPRRMQIVLELLRERGLTVSNVNAFTLFAQGDTYHPTWIEADERLLDARIAHTLASLHLAGQLGSKSISIQPGGPLIGTGLSRAAAGQRFADALHRVLPLARQLGVIVAIEPEPGLFIESAGEYAQFKREFFAHEPMLRMNCDIGHLFCVGDDPAEVIRTMPGEIAHVHLEDIGKNHVHQHLPLGEGAIDFGAIFAALEETKYGGWVTVELYPYETTAAEVARKAFEYLQPLLV